VGPDEWRSVPTDTPHVEKIADLKFLACPVSVITGETWELLRLVNICTNREGDILHLPEPEFAIVDQSPRFLKAVELVRGERNSEWYRDLIEKRAKEG
jgi:hypothetical protein